MSDADALTAYNMLVDWLKVNKLEWVANQITDEVVVAKTKPERISISDETKLIAQVAKVTKEQPAREPSAKFLSREEYSPREQFEIAIGAVRAVIIGAIKIQDALCDAIEINNGEIHFVPGEIGEIEHSFRGDDLVFQRGAVDNLNRLLDELEANVKQ